MQGCTLLILIVPMLAIWAMADDPDVADDENKLNIDFDETLQPESQDDFEKSVLRRLSPDLAERMKKFFTIELGKVPESEMRQLFETTFTPEEQNQIENVFAEVVTEQMQSLMGNMGDLSDQMDQLSNFDFGKPHFDDWNEYGDDHVDLDSENDSVLWGNNKKFVLEPAESKAEELQEKGSQTDEGEDEIVNNKDEL